MKIVLPIILVIAICVLVGARDIKQAVEGSAAASLAEKARDGLKLGEPTTAERAWRTRVGRECKRRNARLAAVRPPSGGLEDLHRYAVQVLRVQRSHVQALQMHDAPATYASKGAFLEAAEQRKEKALRQVVNAAAERDAESAELAVKMLESLDSSTSGVFRSIGVPACAQLR